MNRGTLLLFAVAVLIGLPLIVVALSLLNLNGTPYTIYGKPLYQSISVIP